MKYYAHTREREPESNWQLLRDHLLQTAEIAQFNCSISNYKPFAYMTALLHDLGKFQPAFQNYLKNGGRKGSVHHASWGAAYIRQLGFPELAFAIDGHHKGLPDKADLKSDVDEFIDKQNELQIAIKEFLSQVVFDLKKTDEAKIPFKDRLERELFTRYIYSILIDSDWLDTEEFCDSERSDKRSNRVLDYELFISKLDFEFNQKSKEGEINKLRNIVRDYADSKAGLSPAFYSLNLPTGMGKTLASLSWGLRHAQKNNLKRIIIVLPYINIIDQTAAVLKNIFGEEWVLEHHSGYNESIKESDDSDGNTLEISKQLATENWDYPIIVTTTVQFFESLFSNKRSKCRKIHNIAESVVIFDEVQTLEKEVVLPTIVMLKNIHKVMRTSFLFCTATQPSFEKRENFDGIENIYPLVDNCEEIFEKTRRVTYLPVNDYEEIEIIELFQLVADQDKSALCVFNTKKTALLFFRQAQGVRHWDAVYHLSTSMCPCHRKNSITAIREDLKLNTKILVVSTQLIEAGVDFDFPCVFREYAPMESIIQTAGRCNREGLMDELGKVYIFKLKESGAPNKQYRSLAQHTLDMIREKPDELYGHELFPKYYRSALNLFVDADKKDVTSSRHNFNFETVSKSYRLISNATEGLFIQNYNEESAQIMSDIRKALSRNLKITREQYRKIQQYSVQVYNHFMYKNQNLYEILPNGIHVWLGKYSMETGISDDPLTADELVI